MTAPEWLKRLAGPLACRVAPLSEAMIDSRDRLQWFRTMWWRRLSARGGRGLDDLVSDVPSRIGPIEIDWLRSRVQGVGGEVIEIGPGDGHATCVLAHAVQSRRQVKVLWSSAIRDAHDPLSREYASWQQTIIRKALVPFVWPIPVSPGSGVARELASAGLLAIAVGVTSNTTAAVAQLDLLISESAIAALPSGCLVAWAAPPGSDGAAWISRLRSRLASTSHVGVLEWGETA